jgi:hypothetical protein
VKQSAVNGSKIIAHIKLGMINKGIIIDVDAKRIFTAKANVLKENQDAFVKR